MRNHAAWALGEIGFASCSGELVGLLADGDAMVRRRAAESLRKLSGKSFGYDPRGEPPGRATAAAKWSAWWKREGEALRKKEAGELRKLFGAAAQGRIIGATRAGEER